MSDKDYNQGKDNEIKMLPLIKVLLDDDTIRHTTKKYCPYDFVGDHKRIELKTRNNTKHKYSTTMISLSKILDAECANLDYYFVFSFQDCNCFIKYDNKLFSKFEKKQGGRNDRGKAEMSQYVYIPVDLLSDF